MDFEWSQEQLELRRTVRRYAERELAGTAYARERPPDFVRQRAKRLAELGFTGITFPAADGGQGSPLIDAVIVLGEISKVCPHTGDVVQAFNFGPIRQLQELGSRELKDRWLLPALKGDVLVSLAMTEPDAGSNLSAMRTRAEFAGNEVVINGSKLFATNGTDADLIITWCRFGSGPRATGAVAVPATSPGFARGKVEHFMSGEAYCEMQFANCRVPADHVLVANDGIRRLMPVFNVERIGNAARALALARSAYEMAIRYSSERRVGESLLRELQGIQWKFADMKMRLDAADLLLNRAIFASATPTEEHTAVAKCFANETALFVADQSMQVFGAYGYSTAYPLEYIFRRVRGWMIAGGTTEILRNRIAKAVFHDAELSNGQASHR